MATEILINVNLRETRAALIENGVLQELHVERPGLRGLAGNLYKGRVSRVLPGMQAAFVDIGLERTAFLHLTDVAQANQLVSDSISYDERKRALEAYDIRDFINEGDERLVQVFKEPLGTKGARLTTEISIPSRFLVYLPFGQGVGISARIEDSSERDRLLHTTEQLQQDIKGGFIVRTVAEGASSEAIKADMVFLKRLWDVIAERSLVTPAARCVHEDLPLAVRMLRDLLSHQIDNVWVDSQAAYEQMMEFAKQFLPEYGDRIALYNGQRPLFDLHNVEEEIKKALEAKVLLKSGGHLVIDQTEAMVTIDVNTGAFVGHRTLEETIFRTNLEATVAIARQLRLRNLGGIIVIDFIDMLTEDHRSQVLQALERELANDPSKTRLSQVSPLGIVEMTRKRTRESLEHVLCRPCPTCQGRRYVKSAQTVAYEIFRELQRQANQFEVRSLVVLAHQDVIDLLLDEESAALGELEVLIGKPIRLQQENLYAIDQFDVVLL